jgi:hypothetical protein
MLRGGGPRQDDATSQLQDVVVLAEAAGCIGAATLLRQRWPDLGMEPSGHDDRIAAVAENLKRHLVDSGLLAEEVRVTKRLAIAAGCYDADDRCAGTIKFWW